MRAKYGRSPTVVSKGGGGVQTHKLLNFYKYVMYNTANNVSNCGGDPVTQLIVNVYQTRRSFPRLRENRAIDSFKRGK